MPRKIEPHPSGDERYKAIDLTIRRFRYEKDALLEVLNAAQETFGYLSRDILIYISNQLGVRMAQVYGVATFYHLFSFDPLGEHHCIVCTGTACHVKGADRILDSLTEAFGIEPGETTPDRMFSVTTARCLGSCGLAPVMVFDGNVRGKETPEAAIGRVRDILNLTRESS